MTSSTHLFLSGETMHPSVIRNAWPIARFVGRTCVKVPRTLVSQPFADALAEDDGQVVVWGVAIQVDEAIAGRELPGHLDAGDEITLTIQDDLLLGGVPDTVVSNALYWELPPAYTAVLRAAAGVAAPDAEGGWESPLLEAEPPATAL
jgi:hypothetical protein